MQRTNIYLDEAQAATLDRAAAEQGTSRSELIRELLSRALAGDDADVEADLAALEESFGVLATDGDSEVPVRDDAQRTAHLDRMWATRATR